jgi:hypothetical protein
MFIAHFNYSSVQHLLFYVRMNLGYLFVYIRSDCCMCCFRVVSNLAQHCVSLQVCEIGHNYVLLEGL